MDRVGGAHNGKPPWRQDEDKERSGSEDPFRNETSETLTDTLFEDDDSDEDEEPVYCFFNEKGEGYAAYGSGNVEPGFDSGVDEVKLTSEALASTSSSTRSRTSDIRSTSNSRPNLQPVDWSYHYHHPPASVPIDAVPPRVDQRAYTAMQAYTNYTVALHYVGDAQASARYDSGVQSYYHPHMRFAPTYADRAQHYNHYPAHTHYETYTRAWAEQVAHRQALERRLTPPQLRHEPRRVDGQPMSHYDSRAPSHIEGIMMPGQYQASHYYRIEDRRPSPVETRAGPRAESSRVRGVQPMDDDEAPKDHRVPKREREDDEIELPPAKAARERSATPATEPKASSSAPSVESQVGPANQELRFIEAHPVKSDNTSSPVDVDPEYSHPPDTNQVVRQREFQIVPGIKRVDPSEEPLPKRPPRPPSDGERNGKALSTCTFCGERMLSSSLFKHMKWSCNSADSPYNQWRQKKQPICYGCGKQFSRKDSYSRHIKAGTCQVYGYGTPDATPDGPLLLPCRIKKKRKSKQRQVQSGSAQSESEQSEDELKSESEQEVMMETEPLPMESEPGTEVTFERSMSPPHSPPPHSPPLPPRHRYMSGTGRFLAAAAAHHASEPTPFRNTPANVPREDPGSPSRPVEPAVLSTRDSEQPQSPHGSEALKQEHNTPKQTSLSPPKPKKAPAPRAPKPAPKIVEPEFVDDGPESEEEN